MPCVKITQILSVSVYFCFISTFEHYFLTNLANRTDGFSTIKNIQTIFDNRFLTFVTFVRLEQYNNLVA